MESKKDLPKDAAKKSTDPGDVISPLGEAGESLEFSVPDTKTVSTTDDSESFKSNSASDSKSDSQAADDDNSTSAIVPGKPVKAKHHRLGALWERINIYLLLFVFIIAASVTIVAFIFFKNRSASITPAESITQQKLSSDTLQELASNGVQVGDPKQVLNIQSNSVFAGTVLVKGELQVAGGLKIGTGSLNIPDVVVGGTAIVNQLQAKSLAVAGNAAIQGQLTVQQNLSVNGSGTFNGAVTTPVLTAGKLQLSGDLVLTRHLIAGGSIPGRVNGSGLGSGGTSSISGSDTSGSISVNTGSGASAGCMVTVNFSQPFTATPHVSLTPVGSGAAGIDYYVNRTTSNFSVCSINSPPSNQTFGFDYFITQ
jgi:cytoskeletal protein CcmA (bactofilin family)